MEQKRAILEAIVSSEQRTARRIDEMELRLITRLDAVIRAAKSPREESV